MNIWIMRHGEAGFDAPTDAARSLTNKGVENVQSQGKWLGQQLAERNIQLDKIIVSPYLRAKQTLENLLEGIQAVNSSQHFTNVIEEWEEITPKGNPEMVVNYLHFLREEGAKQVLLVSHLPLVYDLTQSLTHHQANVMFPTATIAEISWSQQVGEIIQIKHA